MSKFKLLVILICLCFSATKAAKRNYVINITSFTCENNTTVVKSFNCHLERRGLKLMGFGYVLQQEPIRDFKAHLLAYISTKNRPNLQLLNHTIDMCKFLGTVQTVKFFNQFKATLFRSVNELPQCPGKLNFNYTMQNFYYNEEDFPSYLPEAKFYGSMRTFVNNDFSRFSYITATVEVIHLKDLKKISRG